MYFRYPSPAASDGDQRSVSHQLVQCVYKKTSYPSPIQVKYHFSPEMLWSCGVIRTYEYLPHLRFHFGLCSCSSWRGWAPSAGLQMPSTPSTPSTREDCLNWGPATNSSSPSLHQRWSTQTIPQATLVPSVWTSERKGRKKKERMGRWMDKWVG